MYTVTVQHVLPSLTSRLASSLAYILGLRIVSRLAASLETQSGDQNNPNSRLSKNSQRHKVDE